MLPRHPSSLSAETFLVWSLLGLRKHSRQDTSLASHSVPRRDTGTRGGTGDILHKTVAGKFGQCPNIQQNSSTVSVSTLYAIVSIICRPLLKTYLNDSLRSFALEWLTASLGEITNPDLDLVQMFQLPPPPPWPEHPQCFQGAGLLSSRVTKRPPSRRGSVQCMRWGAPRFRDDCMELFTMGDSRSGHQGDWRIRREAINIVRGPGWTSLQHQNWNFTSWWFSLLQDYLHCCILTITF